VIVFLLAEPIHVEVSQPQHEQSLIEGFSAYAWPLVVLAALLLLHRPIRTLLEKIAERATELSIGSWVAFKLPLLEQGVDDKAVLPLKDVAGAVWQESGTNLLEHLLQGTRLPEYALVDVGDGKEWISSRLFIFSVILQRMKGLRCIVFVSTADKQYRTFIGCASPDNVRWRLAADQPWLEAAFAQAYSNVALAPANRHRGSPFTDSKGALQLTDAQLVISQFMQSLKEAAPHAFPAEYVQIQSGDEHATWMTVAELQRIMDAGLWTDSVPENTDQTPEANRLQVRRILRKSSPYVAQTRNGAFVSLISRVALLDEVADRFK
jgi:hypothetical protein